MGKKRFIPKLIAHIKNYLYKNDKDHIPMIAGQSAFFVLLSAIPFFIFTFSLLTAMGISQDILMRYYVKLEESFNLGDYLQKIIDETYNKSMELAFTTVAVTLWSAGNGIYAVTQGLDIIYGIDDERHWLVKRFLATLHTLFLLLVLVILPLSLFLFDLLYYFVAPYMNMLPFAVQIVFSLRYLLFFLLLVMAISVGLKFYLRTRVKKKYLSKFKMQLPGAVITALGWIAVSRVMNIYIKNFNGFSLYGSLTYLAGMMFSVYFTIYIFLCGVQFNYIYCDRIYFFLSKKFLFRTDRARKLRRRR